MFRCDRRCDRCDGKFENFVGTRHTPCFSLIAVHSGPAVSLVAPLSSPPRLSSFAVVLWPQRSLLLPHAAQTFLSPALPLALA